MSVPASSPTAPPLAPRTGRWLAVMLALWAVGVLTVEALASAGMVGCALGLLWETARAGGAARVGAALRVGARRWWMLWPFLLWALVGPLLLGHPPRGSGVARLLDWAAAPVAAAALARLDPFTRARVAWVAAAVFLLSCTVAGLQHLGAWPAPEQLGALAWTRLPFHRVMEELPDTPGRFMGGGLVFHRLKFAHVGALAVVWAAAFGLSHRGRTGRAWLGVAVLGAGAVVAFPFARAASVAMLVSCGVLTLLLLPRRLALRLGAGVAVAGLLALAVHAPLRARFLSARTAEGSGERDLLLGAGWKALRAHPVAGVGPGRFVINDWVAAGAPEYILVNGGKSHNQLLTVAVETGAVGAALFVLLLVGLLRSLRPTRWEGAAGLASLVLFGLLSLVHDPLFQAQFSMALALALGAARGRDGTLAVAGEEAPVEATAALRRAS